MPAYETLWKFQGLAPPPQVEGYPKTAVLERFLQKSHLSWSPFSLTRGQRNADDNNSTLTANAKRVRLPSRSRRNRVSIGTETKREEFDHLPPLVSENSTLPIDPASKASVEVAQKAMEVWKKLQHSTRDVEIKQSPALTSEADYKISSHSSTSGHKPSSIGDQQGHPASASTSVSYAPTPEIPPKDNGIDVKTPTSDTQIDKRSVSRHSNQNRAQPHFSSMTQPTERKQRTPLPSQRDKSPPHEIERDMLISTMQPAEAFSSNNVDSGGSEDETNQVPGNVVDYLASRTNESPRHGSARASWEPASEIRDERNSQGQSPALEVDGRIPMPQSLPVTASQFHSPAANPACSPGIIHSCPPTNVVLSKAMRESGPLNTFPSAFSGMNTDSLDQQRSQPAKRRGRKPANDEGGKSQRDIVASTILSQSQMVPSTNVHTENRGWGSSAILTGSPRGGSPTIPHGYDQSHQPQPPRPSASPPLAASSQPPEQYRPPAVIFTLDNRAESLLTTADAQAFVETFTQNSRVVLSNSYPIRVEPIGVIMWQNWPGFSKWYMENTGVAETGDLRFELIDVHWQPEKSFVVPEGSLHYFRTLKQYIWDLYWVASNMNKGPGMFRVSISQFQSRAVTGTAPGSPSTRGWKATNSNKVEVPVNTATSMNLQNIMLVPDSHAPSRRSPQAFPHQASHSSSSGPLPNRTGMSEPKYPVWESSRSSPINVSRGLSSLKSQSFSSEFSPNDFQQHNRMVSGSDKRSSEPQRPFSPVATRRSLPEAITLGDFARSIAHRYEFEVLDHESTALDELPYKTGSEVCGAIIDRRSGRGMVTLTGKGYTTTNIATNPDEAGDRYREISIHPKQTCTLRGGAVVHYYRHRRPGLQPPAPAAATWKKPPPQPEPEARNRDDDVSPGSTTLSQPGRRGPGPPSRQLYPSSCTAAPRPQQLDIIIRIQVSASGKFSAPFPRSVLQRPHLTTADFFAWFAAESRHCLPHGPPHLRFTFKDAMPGPSATEVERGNEDHFNYMRRDIRAVCEKARSYCPELREFGVLVTVPGWVEEGGQGGEEEPEDEDW
ncbi:uncharacterized protein L3040_007511 [Drepanopeziza brunnea f. sp. 'multigermtubi']|uniref:uncharacterized protein n=1 Tax=Drepanopeziza brunnea f. sp. 'multigermtubi' TaxID=698441 RepID=UPI0023870745|nr:hypothetical protein L3040_007511 [Drepanopeziza brunnea f. sp. 'multigermtubi']